MQASEQIGFLSGFVFFVFLLGMGIVALACTQRQRSNLNFQLKLFAGAFALRYSMSVIIYALGLIKVLKDEDGSGWMVGVAYHQNWVEQGYGLIDLPILLAGAYTGRHAGYFYLLGGLFFFVEEARLPAAALNGLFGSLMIVFAYRIAATLFTSGVSRRVGLWLCFLPSMVIWSSQTIKEPVVMLLETLAVYGCVNVRKLGFSLRHTLLTFACIALLIPFRFYAAYVTTAAALAAIAFPKIERGRLTFGPIAAMVIIIGLLSYSGVLAGAEKQRDKMDLRYIETIRTYAASGGSGVSTDFDIATPGGMGISLAIGSIHLLLAPFPWHLASGGLRTLMVGPEMIFWWWLFFAGTVPGFFFLIRTRLTDILPMLIVLLGFGILYSMLFGNVGLIYRQRAQLMPWLLMFAAVGLERRFVDRLSIS